MARPCATPVARSFPGLPQAPNAPACDQAVCGGDGLKDPKMLAMAGLSASAARSLASKVVQAESAMPAPRRALLSLFDGMVHMDAQGQHPPSAHPAH